MLGVASWASHEFLSLFFFLRINSFTFARDSLLFVGIWHSSDKQH